MSAAANIEWYRNSPVEDSKKTYLIDLNYPAAAMREGILVPESEVRARERIEARCLNGQETVPLAQKNVVRVSGGGSFKGHLNTFVSKSRSSNCDTNFNIQWRASDGHFFFIEDGKVRTYSQNADGGRRRKYEDRITPHEGNVNLDDGTPQALQNYSAWGRAAKERRGRSRDCGTTISFKPKQYPNICLPYLVDGYVE